MASNTSPLIYNPKLARRRRYVNIIGLVLLVALSALVYIQGRNSYEVHKLLGIWDPLITTLEDAKAACEANLPRDIVCKLEIHAVVSDTPADAVRPNLQDNHTNKSLTRLEPL